MLWRVAFLEFSPSRPSTMEFGPWQPERRIAEGWLAWFKSLGFNVALQDSSGKFYGEGLSPHLKEGKAIFVMR